MRRWMLVGICCLLGGLTARADDPVFSGPQAGEKLTPFKARAFSGPRAGEEVELPGPNEGKPTVLVFVHEITRPALQLIRPIDHFGAKWADLGLMTHVVWLAADPAQAEQFLDRAKNSLGLKSPVAIALGGVEGPGNYGLNRNVTLTILVANEGKVVANFAIVQPNETDAPKVLAEVAKLVDKPAPSTAEIKAELAPGTMRGKAESNRPDAERIADLEEQVFALTSALKEALVRIARLEGSSPSGSIGPRGTAAGGKPVRDMELQRLMRRLIQQDATGTQIGQTVKEMVVWAGGDARRKAELIEYGKQVLELGYGTEAAQDALRRLTED